MADFITTAIGQSITGTSGTDNMTFGTEVIGGVPFVATGSLSGAGGDDSFFTLNAAAIGPGGPLFNGIQYAYGNEGNDSITLGGLFIAYGGKDNDLIRAGAAALGGDGGDVASQQFFGGEGADTILAGGGNDYIEGNEGADSIIAGTGNDFIWGGKANDIIQGELGLDTIYGNLGADEIFGGANADSLIGGQGNDRIFGGDPNPLGQDDDTIIGGAGNDILSGSAVHNAGDTATISNSQYDDIFRYQDSSAANVGVANVDAITDFHSAIQLPPNPPGTAAPVAVAANFLPDKISFATGADAVLAGLNFTSSTQYDLNRIFVTTPNTQEDASFINPNIAGDFETPITAGLPTNVAGNRAIDLDRVIAAAGPDGLWSSYEEVFTAINQLLVVNAAAAAALGAAGTAAGGWRPIASTSDTLQVYNFYSAGGFVAPTLGTGLQTFLFINGQDTTISGTTDMLIQGVNVVDGGGAIGDIVFG